MLLYHDLNLLISSYLTLRGVESMLIPRTKVEMSLSTSRNLRVAKVKDNGHILNVSWLVELFVYFACKVVK